MNLNGVNLITDWITRIILRVMKTTIKVGIGYLMTTGKHLEPHVHCINDGDLPHVTIHANTTLAHPLIVHSPERPDD